MPVRRSVEHRAIVQALLRSPEPSIRWKVRVEVLKEDPGSARSTRLQEEIRRSARARALITRCRVAPEAGSGLGVYAKWQGVHWALASLADIAYPRSDPRLRPLADAVYRTWLRSGFYLEFDTDRKVEAYRRAGVPRMRGRYRRCASQQGNALRFLTELGLADERSDQLVERLLHWQWPDGGWNCDKEPSADTSSFMETRHAMIGLARYGHERRNAAATRAARDASEVFLRRRLFRRASTGTIIHPDFVKLHFPLYWHYDVLGGLQAMAALGRLGDPRCHEALDWLESRRLRDGGWPADRRCYRVSATRVSMGTDLVDWGGTSPRRHNEWVTASALAVLAAAERLAA